MPAVKLWFTRLGEDEEGKMQFTRIAEITLENGKLSGDTEHQFVEWLLRDVDRDDPDEVLAAMREGPIRFNGSYVRAGLSGAEPALRKARRRPKNDVFPTRVGGGTQGGAILESPLQFCLHAWGWSVNDG
jgi:hypothetical protein